MTKKLYNLFYVYIFCICSLEAQTITLNPVSDYLQVYYEDQQGIRDCLFVDDKIFFLSVYYYAHSMQYGVKSEIVTFNYSSNTLTRTSHEEILSILYEYQGVNGIIKAVPENQQLQGRIVKIGDTIYMPDNSGNAHQFSLDGKPLGFSSGFSKLEQENTNAILSAGKFLKTPFTLFDQSISKVVELQNYYILQSNEKYICVNKNDLAINGSVAARQEYTTKWDSSFHKYTPVKSLNNDYFMIWDKNILKIYKAKVKGAFQEISFTNSPNSIYPKYYSSKDNIIYEISGNPGIYLRIYKISGFDFSSSITPDLWTKY